MPYSPAYEPFRSTLARLQPRLIRVVDHNQCDSIVRRKVANADKLLVPAEIREGESAVADHLQESFRTAPVLNVRPPRRPETRCIKAVAFGDERGFVRAELVEGSSGLPLFVLLYAMEVCLKDH